MYSKTVKKFVGKPKDNIPSWARGLKPLMGQSISDFVKSLLDTKYGRGKYKTGPGSEYSK